MTRGIKGRNIYDLARDVGYSIDCRAVKINESRHIAELRHIPEFVDFLLEFNVAVSNYLGQTFIRKDNKTDRQVYDIVYQTINHYALNGVISSHLLDDHDVAKIHANELAGIQLMIHEIREELWKVYERRHEL